MAVDADALIEHHNSVVRRASVRALDLERRMISVLTPVFDTVADEAARNFSRLTGKPLQIAAAATPGVTPTSTMICLKPTQEQAEALAQPGGVEPENIHCTLLYLGDFEGDLADLAVDIVNPVAVQHGPLTGEVGGVASFSANGDKGSPSIVLPNVRGLAELRVALAQALVDHSVDYPRTHGFTAHMTLGYTPEPTPPPDSVLGLTLDFDAIKIVRGDVEELTCPLTGALPVTASLTAAMGIVATSDKGKQVGEVAEAHAEGCLPDYGDCYWHKENGKVFWIIADYTTSEQIEAGIDAFMAVEGVSEVEACDECGAPAGDGWEKVYGYVSDTAVVAAAPNGTVSDAPTWTPPALDDLIDLSTLVTRLRARMDPVTRKALLTVMQTAVEEAPVEPPEQANVRSISAAGRKPRRGYRFDINNPYAQDQLAKSGQHITGIADSTRRKVARIVQQSYANGDSVPNTAAAIREGMRSLSPARSMLIARTELAGAVNGGSLAATQMLDAASGGLGISKVWLTAPGARYPRHEDYDGLDGQTQQLNDPFTVGDQQLQYPGDPDGDPSEVCNCRCAISYSKAGQVIAQGSAEDVLDPEAIAEEASGGDSGGVSDLLAVENATPEEVPAEASSALDNIPPAKILSAPTEERPYGHLKQSGLNRRIEATRANMRRLLAQPEMSAVERYHYERSEERLKAALRERDLRKGVDRALAHVSDDDLKAMLAQADGRLAKRLAKAERTELEGKVAEIKAEIQTRAQAVTPTPARGAKLRERQTREVGAGRKKSGTTKRRQQEPRPGPRGGRRSNVQISRRAYTPPVKAKNARMKRLQNAYEKRYNATSVEHGQWSISYATDAPTLEEVKAAGADFYDEVEARVARALRGQDATPRMEVIARRETILSVLSEIRLVGANFDGLTVESDSELMQIVKRANEFFPRDWAGWVGDTRIDVQPVSGKASQVIMARDKTRAVVALNTSAYNEASRVAVQDGQNVRAALHELGHVYERFVPDLSGLEREYYAERCNSERAVQMYERNPNVIVRKDEWVNAYMGRDYYDPRVGSMQMPGGEIFEVLSMGMESIITNSYPVWDGDPETASVILGMLVSF